MNILIVEDDDQLRELLLTFLSDLGYNTQASGSVSQALEWLKNDTFDLVLTDKNIEGQDGNVEGGMDVLRFVKSQNIATQVIMMTGFATVETAIEALKLGAFDYIMKPFKLDDLQQKVKRIDEYKKMIDPENTLFTYKTLHNEILELIQSEKDLNDDEMKAFLKNLDKQIDHFFKGQKRWNLSWFNIKKNNENGSNKR